MNILFKDVNQPIHSMFIPNSLRVMQQLVDGLIEPVQLTEKTTMICNDMGKLNGMKKNFYLEPLNDWIFGPVIFVGVDGEDFCDLDDDEADLIRKMFKEAGDVEG